MTMSETLDYLDAVKAYFPASYRNYTPQEAKNVVVVWQGAFSDVPLDIMLMALSLHKDVKAFAPSVAEIRKQLCAIHTEAGSFLTYPPFLKHVSQQEIARRRRIYELTAPYSNVPTPSAYFPAVLSPGEQRLLDSVEF